MATKRKQIKKSNKTRKIQEVIAQQVISDEDKKIVCKNYYNTYDTFEDKVEEEFKRQKIDFLSANYDLEKDILKAHKTAINPSNIAPNEDYYSYINERWIQDFNVEKNQKYIIQVDDFRLVQDKVYRQLLDIVKEYITTDKSEQAKCIGNVYNSFKHPNTNKKSREYANLVLKQIDDLRANPANVWTLLGFINTIELVSWGCPLSWSLNADDKNPEVYRCYVDAPRVTLVDIDVYFEDGIDVEYKRKYKARYLTFLKDLFANVFGPKHEFNVEDIFNVELKILIAMGCTKIKKEDPNGYNVVKTKEALTQYGFDWEQFSAALGFKYTPEFFITSNLNYLKCVSKLLADEWTTPEWRTYWIYIFIRQQQRYNVEGHKIYYDFHGKFVRGQAEEVNFELFPIYGLGYSFNTYLTNEYIRRYENKQHISYVKTMAEDLKTVFIRIIKRNKWLQPETKKMALKKLNNFKLEVGSPKILREDPLLDYTDDDPWGNLIKTAKWRHERGLKLEGQKIIDLPLIDWAEIPPKFIGTQAYVVNASYTPSQNGIYIPLGYIQPPFVDLEERGIEYNLAHVGYTIGHEMSHALDDWGSKYDHTGKMNDWWTEKDKAIFKRIQDDVIKQYEVFAAQDGIIFDASPSIGEDLADISGLTICREYLRDFQLKNQDILPIQRISFEAFFVYFAAQQRQQISKRAIQAQLKTNPHPLDKYRTNVPLSRLPVFRIIYDVKKGDKMWWHSTNRVWEG